MPLYQVPQMAKGSHELDHFNMSNCAADLAYGPDDELVELLWENGQIVMQGQSNISRRNSSFTGSNSNPSKVQEKDLEGHVIPKIGTYGGSLQCFENCLSSSGLIQEDDMVPWLRCPVGDSLQNEDCSEFVTAFAVNSMNSAAAHSSVVPTNSFGQEVKDTQRENPEPGNSYKITSGGSRLTGSRSNQLFASAQRPVANVRPEASMFVFSRNSSKEAPCRYSTQTLPVSSGPLPSATIQKKDSKLPQSNNNTPLMNFSHFSRPSALVKTNLESLHKLKCHDKMSKPVPGNNPIEQSVVESTSVKSVERDVGVPVSLMPMVYMTDMRNKPNQVLASANQSEMFFQVDTSKNSINRSPEQILNRSSSFAVSVTLGRPENEKFSEPAGASSSVCSRNSDGAASHDPKHELDRKNHEAEESDYPSYDADYESVQARKPTLRSGTSAKRSRAAEVHNLSERKRRDRINEKMRALQELIPNCNKVDKASMLDEAIEYLKTLQMQVQIMSMRTGLCMSPLILPAKMPPIHRPHMAHLSPMNFGMGMSMRVGLGSSMIDMPGMSGSSGFPLMPGIQFPSSSISGPANFHMMSGSSLPMFGVQGHMMPVAPFIPFSSYATKEVPLSDVQGASPAVSLPVPNSPFPSSSSNDAM